MSRTHLAVSLLTLAVAATPAQAAGTRVLLYADAAVREYQFLRSLFVREMDKNRAEVSTFLQTDRRPGVVADVPNDRVLKGFPSGLDGDPKVPGDGLKHYDVIVAFDPDWTKLSKEQTAHLRKWVDFHGGGLIVVAGPVNLHKLTDKADKEKLGPVLELLPVVPDKPGADAKPAEKPQRLAFDVPADFLKLDPDGKGPTAGWDDFFADKRADGEAAEPRGFYTPCPVKQAKAGALVHARVEKDGAGKECTPYLVSLATGKGRVVYVGSAEMWRLRAYREAFHERFWLGLAAFAAPR